MAPDPGGQVADLVEALAHRLEREPGRVGARHLLPGQRCRGPRVGGRTDRVGGGDRPVARVLAVVDEDAPPVGHLPGRGRDILVADAPLDLLRERLGEAPHLRKPELRLDRREDVQPCRAGGLRERGEPELVHHLLDHHRDLAHIGPGVALARVEVDQEVVGPVDVVDARMPGVELDAPEVGDPGERGRLVADGEVGAAPARKVDVHGLEPVRVRLGNTLLVEEKPVHALRVALHLHRPPLDVVQNGSGNGEVIGDQVALRQPRLGEVHLVRVGDVDLAPPNPHAQLTEPSASSASSPCSTMSPSLNRMFSSATRHFGLRRIRNSRSIPKCLNSSC